MTRATRDPEELGPSGALGSGTSHFADDSSASLPKRALAERPIIELAPRVIERPFIPLATQTPVEPLTGFPNRVWVKRDDLSATRYGGNKVRRWEWILGDARARGAASLLTVGGLGSTQVVSLAAHGPPHGFGVHAVLYDQEDSAFVRAGPGSAVRFGATVQYAGGYASTALATVKALAARPGTYFVPPGAMGALANLSYVDGLLELKAQVDAGLAPKPDAIVVACGSGGTASALALGAALASWDVEIIAVRITEAFASNTLTLGAQVRATEKLLRKLGCTARRSRLRLRIEPRFTGPGYGTATPEARRGARRFEEAFGVVGEVTYSGKAFAALEQFTREEPTKTALLWNTLSTTGRATLT